MPQGRVAAIGWNEPLSATNVPTAVHQPALVHEAEYGKSSRWPAPPAALAGIGSWTAGPQWPPDSLITIQNVAPLAWCGGGAVGGS